LRKWITVAAAVVALAALVAWRIDRKRAEMAVLTGGRAARGDAPVAVAVAPVVRRDIVQTFSSIGNIEAPLNTALAPKTTGRIEFLEVREGDRVRKGQVLVRLDDSELRANVRQREAEVAAARHRLAQARTTQFSTDTAVQSQVQQQSAALASALSAYRQAQQAYAAELAGAKADVTAAQGKVDAATADVRNAEADTRRVAANLDNARSRYSRASSLLAKGFVSAQAVDDARTGMAVQEAELQVAEARLSSAKALLKSAEAARVSSEERLNVVKTKGPADIAAAKAVVTQARAALAAARANTMQSPAYKENLSALQAAVDVADAQRRNALAQLANTVITSPVDGFVTARLADPGATASPSQPVLRVQAIRQVYVSVPVPEDVARLVYVGQPAKARFDALPGRTFGAKVAQVNAAADPASRQFQVRLLLDNRDGSVKPGMFGRVSIETGRTRDVLVVPREAVKDSAAGKTVTVATADDTAEVRSVVTGVEDTAGIALMSGVREGEMVVTMSAGPLRDGQKLRLPGKANRGAQPAGAKRAG
jgi:RND family efflux transporter MFP subunit